MALNGMGKVASFEEKMDNQGHVTRFSDSSLYDFVCVNCGATDSYNGNLDKKCPNPGKLFATDDAWYADLAMKRAKNA